MNPAKNRDNHDNKDNVSIPNSTITRTGHSRLDIVTSMDDFIFQMLKIRRTLLYISISALILVPLAIGLSLFLISHPTFFAVLEIEMISYRPWHTVGSANHYFYHDDYCRDLAMPSIVVKWTKGYREFQREREEADRKIAEEYGIET